MMCIIDEIEEEDVEYFSNDHFTKPNYDIGVKPREAISR